MIRRPHMLVALVAAVPLMVVEVVALYRAVTCGGARPAVVALATLLVVLAPAVLPGTGLLLDRARAGSAAASAPVSPGPLATALAPAAARMVALAGVHLGLALLLLGALSGGRLSC